MIETKSNKIAVYGFTLIEVMVALVLLAFSLGAVLSSVNQSSFQLGQSRDRFHAHRVAMHVAGQYKVLKIWPSTGKKEDTTKVGGADWKWEAQTSNTADKNVRRVLIKVFAPGSKDADASVLIFQSKPL